MAKNPTHNTSKTHIVDLVHVLEKLGVQRIMLSPGSRSAPLVIALERSEGIECMTITDERCAAFFALGVALARDEAVGMICTSGSAPLNYSPALAEAF
ncbi:MAG: thiamine pyrophosphate-binding protein, partial [Bacteroidota bacterium]|nr:thiamine pyrophosphate-binding protein [Bacteroidota bacterium]